MNPESKIAGTPRAERPRERCLSRGPSCLSLRECLALILGSGPAGHGCLGVAAAVLARHGSDLPAEAEEDAFFSAMEYSGTSPLARIHGLGESGRARLLAAFEVGRRYSCFRDRRERRRSRSGQIHGPEKGGSRRGLQLPERALDQISADLRAEAREWLGFVPCWSAGTTGEAGPLCVVERGVRTHVNVDPSELFARVLALRPNAFYLFHNHPSGDLTPSEADFDLTRKVSQVAAALGTRLLGHGIVTARGERWIVL